MSGHVIDFQPLECSGIEEREGCIALVFPAQAMYFDGWMEAGVIAYHLCELRIEGARQLHAPGSLPMAYENLTVRYEGGSRRCYLPVDFRAKGPIQVIFEFECEPERNVVVAEGHGISLHVIRQTGEERIRRLERPA